MGKTSLIWLCKAIQNVILTVLRGFCVLDGRLVNGRVDEKILAEVLEVAVHAGSAPHGCNAFKGLFSLNGRVPIWRLRSRDSPV